MAESSINKSKWKNSLGKRIRRLREDGLVLDEVSRGRICLDIDIHQNIFNNNIAPRDILETNK